MPGMPQLVAVSDQPAQTIIDEMLSSVILEDLNQNSTVLEEVEELTDEFLTTASPVRNLGPKVKRPSKREQKENNTENRPVYICISS